MTNINEKIKLPAVTTINGEERNIPVEAVLIDNKQPTADDKLIKSLQYLPDFLQEKPVMKDASRLLDACLSEDQETLAQIREAYCDTLYKLPGYNNLSYGAKISLLKEEGFDYVLNLLLHVYDEEYAGYDEELKKLIPYEKFVQQKCDKALSNITMLFNLLNILKGKTIGLELAFKLVNLPSFLYIPWDVCTVYKGEWEGTVDTLPMPGGDIEVNKGDTYAIVEDGISTGYVFNGVNWHYCDDYKKYLNPREQFTADLNIYGTGSADLQKRIIEFVRYYMLPYIDVKLNFTGAFHPAYAYPCGTFMLLNTLLFSHYYDDGGNLVHHNLTHSVSGEAWSDTEYFNLTSLIFGQPKDHDKAFQGEVYLKDSFVQDAQGNKHYLWTTEQYVPDAIQGPARNRYNEQNAVTEFYGDDDYVSAPVRKGYVEVDITTGEQKNPIYNEATGEFDRDTLVNFFTCLLVKGVHHAKTIQQMNALHVEDFNKEIKDTEVYGGRETIIYPVSGKVIDTVNNETHLPTGNNRHYLQKYLTLKGTDSSLVNTLYNDCINGIINYDQVWFDYFQPLLDYPFNISVFIDSIKNFIKELQADNKMSIQKGKDITTYIYKQYERFINRELTELDVYRISFEYMFSEKADPMEFKTTTPEVRENVGTEEQIVLKFTDAFIRNNNYTGIGDIGILGSNTYFIYNGMLWYNVNNEFRQIDGSTSWTDVGASHAISEKYFTPAIKDNTLYCVKEDKVKNIIRDWNSLGSYTHHVIEHNVESVDNSTVDEINQKSLKYFKEHYDLSYWDAFENDKWTAVTGYVNEYYTAFAICNGCLYSIYYNELYDETDPEDTQIVYTLVDEDPNWTYITGTYYLNTYEGYGIKNGKLYKLRRNYIEEVKCDDEELVGWDSSIDCISRYHHSNPDYITYGICNGKLYYIQDNECGLLDGNTNWTAICGYYDDKSPRTFAYAIRDYKLYEIQGKDVILKDDTKFWEDISGSTSSTNTFVLGIGKDTRNATGGYLYKINAKTLTTIDSHNTWTDVFGRYTTSTSKAANCYGYAIKDNRIYVISKDDMKIISGMWKLNGEGLAVDLLDYNIEDISLTLPNGEYIEGRYNVIDRVPTSQADSETNYDIYITYDTVGFDNNTRYKVRTELTGTYFTYISPDEAERDGITLVNDPNDFDGNVGVLNKFITKNVITHGNQKINGKGEAYQFSLENTYIELEQDDAQEYIIRMGCICSLDDSNVYPAIYSQDGTSGIVYGYRTGLDKYGIMVKSTSSSGTRLVLIKEVEYPTNNAEAFLKFTRVGNYYNLEISTDGITYDPVFISEYNSSSDFNVLEAPKFLGGNGTTYGDAIFFLMQSSVDGLQLFENGRYLQARSLEMDIVENFITSENQEAQKVIEVNESNGTNIIDLSMNTLYEMMDVETSNNKLEIENNYNYNKLRIGTNEGITKSTLTFSGDYTLDPVKAAKVGRIEELSHYNIDTIADNFSNEDYININPYAIEENPLVITTGDDVNSQYLLNTEEDSAYTNKYLLTSEIDAQYNGDNTLRAVPSGEAYEIITDQPGVVRKTLTFNAEEFIIDENKIWRYGEFDYDSYTAIMTGFSNRQEDLDESEMWDLYLTAAFDIENGTPVGNTIDCLPVFRIKTSDVRKQKIAEFDGDEIIIGDLVPAIRTYDENDETTYTDEYYTGNVEDLELNNNQELVYIEEQNPIFDYEENTEYDLNFNVSKTDNGLKTSLCTKEESLSSEAKDKFKFVDGVASNFSFDNYLKVTNINGTYGLVTCFTTDDDPSKDQSIIGYQDGPSIMIKDSILSFCDASGNITNAYFEEVDEWSGRVYRTKIEIDAEDTYYIALVNRQNLDDEYVSYNQINNTADIYYSEDGKDWDRVFPGIQFPIRNNLILGCSKTDTGLLPWNGSFDLTRSYVQIFDRTENVEDIGTINLVKPNRLYDFVLTTRVKINDTVIKTIERPYIVHEFDFGYNFNGSLDLYNSKGNLLLNYGLEWLEDRKPINTVVRDMLEEADPTYDRDIDFNFYDTEAYGLQLDNPPKRWDSIDVVYTTVDHAYYMQPNTKYYLTCEVIDDKESGKSQVEPVGNATWANGVTSDFNNGYYTYNFTDEEYIVLNVLTDDVTTKQAICGYTDDISQSIIIENGMLKYFDGYNSQDIFSVITGQEIFIKLYTSFNNIEYSLDGENWIESTIETAFSGYDTFQIGKGSIGTIQAPFLGTIDLNKSYVEDELNVTYLFKHYKKVIPYISTDKVNWNPLTLVPLLTIYDYVSFGTGFSGSLDLFNSKLLLEDTIYWTANHIHVYTKDGDIHQEVIIRDAIDIDTDVYYSQDLIEKVTPEEMSIKITGLPLVGDTITLTYNCWYMFRKQNTEYEFNVEYKDKMYITYNELDGRKYTLYVTEPRDVIVNSGIEFDGTIDLRHSTRGGMTMVETLEWDSYNVMYKKYNDTEWTYWTKFTLQQGTVSYMRTGYDLKGKLQMDTSYVATDEFHTPFISYYDSRYITIVGDVDIQNGTAKDFDNGYLQIIPDLLENGCMVEFSCKQYEDIANQGIGTNVILAGGNVVYKNNPREVLHKAFPDYKFKVRYYLENGKLKISYVGANYTYFTPRRSPLRTIDIIPFNSNIIEGNIGYYVTTQNIANNIHLSYRLVNNEKYDTFTREGGTWYDVPLAKKSVPYYLENLEDIFVGTIELGYTVRNNAYINANRHKLPYHIGDIIQYRIIVGDLDKPTYVCHNHFVAYNDMTLKQELKF